MKRRNADDVYAHANSDLVAVLDALEKEPLAFVRGDARGVIPRPRLDDEDAETEARVRDLEASDDYQWICELAGALGLPPQAIYNEQLVDLQLERRADARRRERLALAPTREKQRERRELEGRVEALRVELAQLGEGTLSKLLRGQTGRIIDGRRCDGAPYRGLIPSLETHYYVSALIAREPLLVEQTPWFRDALLARGPLHEGQDERDAFFLLVLFRYLLNRSGTHALGAVVHANAPTVVGEEATEESSVEEVVVACDATGEYEELIDMHSLEHFYRKEAIETMVRAGCRARYTHWPGKAQQSYDEIVGHIVSGRRESVAFAFDAFNTHANDQPPTVMMLFRRLERERRGQRGDEPKEDEDWKWAALTTLLKAHMLWHYFTHVPLADLVDDWFRHGMPAPTTLHKCNQDQFVLLEQQIGFLEEASVQPLFWSRLIRHFVEDDALVIPSRRAATLVAATQSAAFDTLNEAARGLVAEDLMAAPELVAFYREWPRLPAPVVARRPLLLLPHVARALVCQRAARKVDVRRRLEETRLGLERLDTLLAQMLSGVRAPPPPPALRIQLNAQYMHAMSRAYTYVQRFCEPLRDLPLAEFQAQHARESGLMSAFAHFVATQVALQEGVHPTRYTPLHAQRRAIAMDTHAFAELRRFTWGRDRDGRYTSRLVVDDEQEAEEARRWKRPRNNLLLYG